ncbi:hypothetical protein BHE74_00020842 [Ensete ventricosum]|nr:hypothetical protein BHE74_00020842 [Ensete ventricosum]
MGSYVMNRPIQGGPRVDPCWAGTYPLVHYSTVNTALLVKWGKRGDRGWGRQVMATRLVDECRGSTATEEGKMRKEATDARRKGEHDCDMAEKRGRCLGRLMSGSKWTPRPRSSEGACLAHLLSTWAVPCLGTVYVRRKSWVAPRPSISDLVVAFCLASLVLVVVGCIVYLYVFQYLDSENFVAGLIGDANVCNVFDGSWVLG